MKTIKGGNKMSIHCNAKKEDIKKMNRLLDLLNEDDDVQAVYHNWDE